MQLVLSFGGKVLECVDITPSLARNEKFLNALQLAMLGKHKRRFLSPKHKHNFYIEAVSKTANTKREIRHPM